MSLIAEFRNTEADLKALQDRLDALKNDERLQRDLEFQEKLKALMAEYNKSLRNIIEIIDPSRVETTPTAARKARVVKTYTNPHTGEVIETKGGNHKGLKVWKQEFGSDEVESWAK